MRIATLLLWLLLQAGALSARDDDLNPAYVAADLTLTQRAAALLPPADDMDIATLLERPDRDARLAQAVDLPRDPLRGRVYGRFFGYGGDPPGGRVALGKLVEGGARGPGPEGRLDATEGLLRLGRLSDAEKRLVDAARNQKVPIVCAEGCIVLERPAAEALRNGLEDK